MLRKASSDNELLIKEINELRGLLVESSKEIEHCRGQFFMFEREKERLLVELERVGVENGCLVRERRGLEEEAAKWRQNYIRAAR